MTTVVATSYVALFLLAWIFAGIAIYQAAFFSHATKLRWRVVGGISLWVIAGVVLFAVWAVFPPNPEHTDKRVDPIKDVVIDFELYIPWDDNPSMRSYQARLSKCVQEMIATKHERCGALSSTAKFNDDKSLSFTLDRVCMRPGAEIYPSREKEPVMYLLAHSVVLRVSFYRPQPSHQELADHTAIPNLMFMIHKVLTHPDNDNQGKWKFVEFCYDTNKNRLYLTGRDVPADPSEWRFDGKITSVQDLDGAVMVVQPQLSGIPDYTKQKDGRLALSEGSELAERLGAHGLLGDVELIISGRVIKIPMGRISVVPDKSGVPLYVTTIVVN